GWDSCSSGIRLATSLTWISKRNLDPGCRKITWVGHVPLADVSDKFRVKTGQSDARFPSRCAWGTWPSVSSSAPEQRRAEKECCSPGECADAGQLRNRQAPCKESG